VLVRNFRFVLVCLILFLYSTPVIFPQPSVRAVFTDNPPVIDGFVNDTVWKNGGVVDKLFQREPRTGEEVSEKTEFYFLFNQDNFYIGIRCFDSPERITAKELAWDADLGNDDRAQVIFDTYLDGRNGYWFQIGPRGSIGDALISENGKDFNKSWDGIWDGKAKITDNGWEAEMIIPFKTLGFKKGQETWGLKLIRHIKRKSESSYWPATSLNADKFQISDAGRIEGITNITQGLGLDIVPYLTGGISKKQDADSKPVFNGGLDAFYQITPSIKAAVTVNTDFAQTEVDEKQINLTRFSLYFPEKRDFFLDGSNYFTFGINGDRENPHSTLMIPFFSRRLGLDTEGNPIPIIYGGKFTGKAGNWNFGLLHIKDDNEWENSGFSAGRISRNFGKQSSIGIIGTNGNAFSEDINSLAGIDLRLASSKISGNKILVGNLYGVKSFTKGVSGDDLSFGTEINYPNDLFNFRIGYLQIGNNFLPGLGFLPRKNIHDFYGGLGIGPRPDNSAILQVKSGIKYALIYELNSGDLLSSQVDFNITDIIFLSGDIISLASQYSYEFLNKDFTLFTSHTIPAGNYDFWRHSLQVTTAKRRELWVLSKFATGSFYSGKRTDLLLQAGYKIIVPIYFGIESDRKWVSLPDGDFVAQIYRLNLNFLFSPSLSWYNFVQYENQSKTAGWQSRFQWIIKPGREIFLTFNSPLIDPMERFQPEIYEARIKVKYTIRF
jgi:hypothetical protein